MTPAITLLKRKNIEFTLHDYDHDPDCSDYGLEAVNKLDFAAARVFKTLVAELDDARLVVAVVPVLSMLDLKALAKSFKAKKAVMADKEKVVRTTGYILGGVSPLGQKKLLATVIDRSGEKFPTILVSGGRRGLDIELSPRKLAQLTRATFVCLAK